MKLQGVKVASINFESLEQFKTAYFEAEQEQAQNLKELERLKQETQRTKTELAKERLKLAQAKEKRQAQEQQEKINILKQEGFSPKDISKIISKLYGENKNKIYKLVIE